jgi:hypothetical protein
LIRSSLKAVAAGCALVCAWSCGSFSKDQRFRAEELRFQTAVGRVVSVRAEIAVTNAERARGLMYRESVPDGEGMLFVFEVDQKPAFWMKNTEVPLSIAFIRADGRIAEIRDLSPYSLDPVQSERSVRYALEVPRGWFARAGIAVGDRLLDLERIYRSSK